MTHQLELYQYWRSSCSWRVRWALEIKGIAYTKLAINLLKSEQRAPAYLAMNPNAGVPTLKIDGEAYGESLAILEWLEEAYPEPALLPTSPTDRLKVRQMANTITSGTQPLQNLVVLQYYTKTVEEKQKLAAHWIQRGLSAYERLAEKYAGSYSFGSQLTIADLCLIPQCYNAERFQVDLAQFANIQRIYRRCLAREDCQRAAPENQPDAQV